MAVQSIRGQTGITCPFCCAGYHHGHRPRSTPLLWMC